MTLDQRFYLTRRIAEELALAENGPPTAASVHRQMAEAYAVRLKNGEPPPLVVVA